MISGVLGALFYEHEDTDDRPHQSGSFKNNVASNWSCGKGRQIPRACANKKACLENRCRPRSMKSTANTGSICPANIRLPDNKDEFDYALRRFLYASRPRTAFAYVSVRFREDLGGTMRQKYWNASSVAKNPRAGFPENYYIQKAVGYIEQSGAIEKNRLLGLEFALIPFLRFGGTQHAKTLYHAIMSEPKLFTELLCILYKPSHRESDDGPSPVLKRSQYRSNRSAHFV